MALPVRQCDNKRSEVAPWDPALELDRLNRQITKLHGSWPQLADLAVDGFTPLADVEETPDACVIEMELAGVKRDDIDVKVAGPQVWEFGGRASQVRPLRPVRKSSKEQRGEDRGRCITVGSGSAAGLRRDRSRAGWSLSRVVGRRARRAAGRVG